MTTKLTKIGDDLALILNSETMSKLGIDELTPIVVAVDATGIHIRPIRYARKDQVREASQRVMEIHDETLRRLAD